MTPRVLFVLTSHAELGTTDQTTGAYLPEIVHPYEALKAAGVAIDFVSPLGGKPPLIGFDNEDPALVAFLDDPEVMARLERSFRPEEIEPTRYDAIFFAGGHGTMWDLPDQAKLAEITAALYERGAPVAAVCHGPAGLLNTRLGNGRYLIEGHDLAAFTNAEEEAVELTQVVPFLLADQLVARGARHHPAPNWQEQVVVSGQLITGQNPASARAVGEALRAALFRDEAPVTREAQGAASNHHP